MEEAQPPQEHTALERLIDHIFEMQQTMLFLILIFIVGFALRWIAAQNLAVGADDMHFVTHAINFYSSERLITYDQSSGLWFAFTSILYNIFGTTQFASRFAALFFGSFSIFVIYLLAKEFFDEKIALLSAFLLAIAPFHIKNTVAEMDVMAMFFVLTATLLFARALKTDKKRYFMSSGIFLGLAIYTKVYPLLFIPSLLIFFAYWNHKNKKKMLTKDSGKRIALFLFMIFLFTIPALTHNYLLYQDKGFLDLQFTRTLGLGKNTSAQYYSWDHQFNAKNDWDGLIFGDSDHSAAKQPTLVSSLEFIFKGDPLIFLLGISGLLWIFIYRREKKEYAVLFLLLIALVLPFLASIILLPKHYLFFEIFLVPLAAFSFEGIRKRTLALTGKESLKILLVLSGIFSLLYLGTTPQVSYGAHHFYGETHIPQIMEFKEEYIPENALIVVDNRIYSGRIHWPFHGRPYLQALDFANLLQQKETLPGKEIPVDVYFFECIKDDCGWGTIKNQPELNASMETIVAFFKDNGALVKTISEPFEERPYFPFYGEQEEIIRVYKVTIPLRESLLTIANQPKEWFLYSIGYEPKEKQFDFYQAKGFGVLLDKLAHFIVTLALILAFLSAVFILYLTFKK